MPADAWPSQSFFPRSDLEDIGLPESGLEAELGDAKESSMILSSSSAYPVPAGCMSMEGSHVASLPMEGGSEM